MTRQNVSVSGEAQNSSLRTLLLRQWGCIPFHRRHCSDAATSPPRDGLERTVRCRTDSGAGRGAYSVRRSWHESCLRYVGYGLTFDNACTKSS